MPIFGHHNQRNTTTDPVMGPAATAVPTGPRHNRREDPVGLAPDPNYNAQPGDRFGDQYNDQYNDRRMQSGPGMGQPGYQDQEHDRSMPAEYGRGGAGAAGMASTGYPREGVQSAPGYDGTAPMNPNSGTYPPAGQHPGLSGPGTGVMGTNQTIPALREAKKLERSGQVEHAFGTILSSQSMKAKGAAKEQEGRQMRIQAQELGQAERLEREAEMGRKRAVAAGAHPDHAMPGGGHHHRGPTGPGGPVGAM